MKFLQTRLDNGLTVIAEVNPAAASLAAGLFVRTGSRDETADISGVSHFLEHMMFKGTERRTAFDVNREFDEMGAIYNASTSEENTIYYGAVLPEFQTPLLDLLCDIVRPALRAEDFNLEKNVIQDEIALYEDLPRFRVYDRLMKEHFSPHPLANSILGTTESICQLKLQQMQSYFEHRYSPGNITVVGVGIIDFDAFVEKASQMCSLWKPYEVSRDTPQANGAAKTEVLHDAKMAQTHIGIMSPAPSMQSEDRFTAELLANILGDVAGSRLFYALIASGIADEASMNFSPMDGAGGFMTLVSTDASRATEALGIVRQEFKKFINEGPTEDETQATKNKIASGATLKGELPMGRLSMVGLDWIYRQEYISLEEKISMLFDVTRHDIHDMASKFDLLETTVVALGPLDSI